MPFVLVAGTFVPRSGRPDGDTLRFAPDDPSLLVHLRGRRARVSPTTGRVGLRLEGIDAVERGAAVPWPDGALAHLLQHLGTTVRGAPVRGMIATRATDPYGRPIAWLFAEARMRRAWRAAVADGAAEGAPAWWHLTPADVRRSANYRMVRDGAAYPMFYNTLFAELRDPLSRGATTARRAELGVWAQDVTRAGFAVPDEAALHALPPVWPKLWRRLAGWFEEREGWWAMRAAGVVGAVGVADVVGAADGAGDGAAGAAGGGALAGFADWLEAKRERVDVIGRTDERGLEDVLEVAGDRVRMTVDPVRVRVRSSVG